jgi:uncharacterized iron-regulated protein
MKLYALPLLSLAGLVAACSGASPSTDDSSSADTTPGNAPSYDGDGFAGAKILRVADGAYVSKEDLVATLSASDFSMFGEQHMTAPVQALEKWLLGQTLTAVPDMALAMEHFQRDMQPVIDSYYAGTIDQATFEAKAKVWPGYATYWRQVVETAHAANRPLYGLNVPDETFNGIYDQFPTWPLDAFDAITDADPFAASLPARPLLPWDATYQSYFKNSFDYSAHGQKMGLSYDDALHYFTDLAVIRDETMAHWATANEAIHPHLFVICGDWHIQTRLSVPDRISRMKPGAKITTITTSPSDQLANINGMSFFDGRPAADYIITYTPPAAPPTPTPTPTAMP